MAKLIIFLRATTAYLPFTSGHLPIRVRHGLQQEITMKRPTKEGSNGSLSAPFLAEQGQNPLVAGIFTEALNRYLDQVKMQGQVIAAAHRQARRLCGRWLALRRLKLAISNIQVVERFSLEVQALELLELGLADKGDVPEAVWEHFCYALAGYQNDTDFIMEVLKVALGQNEASAKLIGLVEQQMDDCMD